MACMCAACSHSQYTVLHAMLNLLATIVIDPLCRLPSPCMLWSMEIICKHEYFDISLFLGHGGGASSLETSPSSIVHSNWYAKVWPFFHTSSFDCNFPGNDNQTFNVYMESTLSIYRKGLCSFFQF